MFKTLMYFEYFENKIFLHVLKSPHNFGCYLSLSFRIYYKNIVDSI